MKKIITDAIIYGRKVRANMEILEALGAAAETSPEFMEALAVAALDRLMEIERETGRRDAHRVHRHRRLRKAQAALRNRPHGLKSRPGPLGSRY